MMRTVVRTLAYAAAVVAFVLTGCSSNDDSGSADLSTATSTADSSTTVGATTSASPTTSIPPADTSTPESAFVTGLRQANIPVRNDEGAVGTGQRMCRSLADGESPDAAAQFGIDEHPWSPEQARAAVTIAATSLCPENASKVGN